MHPRPFKATPNEPDETTFATIWTEMITAATGATGETAWIVEGIARDEILDGTLTGATRDQIERAFKEAMRIFRTDEATYRELYSFRA